MIALLAWLAWADPVGPMPDLPYGDTLEEPPSPLLPVPPAPRVSVEGEPAVGEEVVVALVDAWGEPAVGRTVQVFHRPGIDGERQVAVGITDSRGRVRWTPELRGVARLQAGDDSLPVVVRSSAPLGTLTVLVLLATAALGAVGWAGARGRGPA